MLGIFKKKKKKRYILLSLCNITYNYLHGHEQVSGWLVHFSIVSPTHGVYLAGDHWLKILNLNHHILKF